MRRFYKKLTTLIYKTNTKFKSIIVQTENKTHQLKNIFYQKKMGNASLVRKKNDVNNVLISVKQYGIFKPTPILDSIIYNNTGRIYFIL